MQSDSRLLCPSLLKHWNHCCQHHKHQNKSQPCNADEASPTTRCTPHADALQTCNQPNLMATASLQLDAAHYL